MALPGVPMGGGSSLLPPAGYELREVRGRSKGTVSANVRITGLKEVQAALREMGGDAPYLRKALEEIGEDLAEEMQAVAPFPSFKVERPKVLGKSPALRVSVGIGHPGARSREFGRKYYYRGFQGRAMKATGYKFKSSPGQEARPYLGVVSGPSVAEKIRPTAEERLVDAYEREWDRLVASKGVAE